MASHEKESTKEEAVQFSFTQFSSNEIKVSVLKDWIEERYGLPKEKQIIYSSFNNSDHKEVEDDQLLLNIPMRKAPGYMNLSIGVCSTAEEIMKQRMSTHGINTIRVHGHGCVPRLNGSNIGRWCGLIIKRWNCSNIGRWCGLINNK